MTSEELERKVSNEPFDETPRVKFDELYVRKGPTSGAADKPFPDWPPEDKRWLPRLANGGGAELSLEQLQTVSELYKFVAQVDCVRGARYRVDYESCRRFLVDKDWDLRAAQLQMTKMLRWRCKEDENLVRFQCSPVCLKNPYALNLRCVGLDKELRPCIYSCFSQSNDRHAISNNMIHLRALLDECATSLMKLRGRYPQCKATQQQIVWIIDFHGFGVKDQNPKTAVLCAHLLSYYPELLSCAVLVDTPWIFNATFALLKNILSPRTLRKVSFVKSDSFAVDYEESLGTEMATWLNAEMKDNRTLKPSSRKAYWKAPKAKDGHDPRGVPSYIGSEYYIPTPGEKYDRRKLSFFSL